MDFMLYLHTKTLARRHWAGATIRTDTDSNLVWHATVYEGETDRQLADATGLDANLALTHLAMKLRPA